ncbi:transcription termination factor Rho [Bifidobacterium sp. UTCIF-37]|uniref:transcription termination factor Rho n=1 Tax=unclassified Bifidobacterium TaxID=2608897 RepID=UPI002158B488|nr:MULTISPECIES: transcription termination factor Rho [unclassified Bifidobacterium]TPF86035.1 transcription termination factor Rho [Bifidobacterium sp. UTCIF-37]TPF88240.1 transcription termination factor Rho [Bifidobacterium sp. UTCIF-38]
MANSQNLEDMKLPELKELAKQMGLRGTSTMRKPELLATLQAARSGGQAPAGVTVRAPKGGKTARTRAAKSAGTTVEASINAQSDAPVQAASNDMSSSAEPVAPVAPVETAEAANPVGTAAAESTDQQAPAAAQRTFQGTASAAQPAEQQASAQVDEAAASVVAGLAGFEPIPASEESSRERTPRNRRFDFDRPTSRFDRADREREREEEQDRAERDARSGRRDRRVNDQDAAASLLDSLDLSEPTPSGEERKERGRRHVIDENGDEIIVANVRRRRRPTEEREQNEEVVRDLDDILATLPTQNNAPRDDEDDSRRNRGDRANHSARNDRGNDRNADRDDHGDRRGRRVRGRDRGRDFEEREDRRDRGGDRAERAVDHVERDWNDDRGGRAERQDRADRNADRRGNEEQNNDLVPVAGIIDVLDSYAFVRTSGYLPGPNDVYVSMGQVKKYGLRKGDAVHGAIRAPREGDRRNQRQKFVPLQSIDSINGMSVEEAANRPQFSKLTPLYPQERLKQETTPNKLTGRIMDIVSPIGKGQRGLIVSPPKAGKTITLQNIANSITTNNPEVHLMVVLVDERPEEVTDMERTVQGEVISSTFDRPASDHTTVAELAIERAKRLVELGQDVVVLLDSMTRLARAYNIAAPASGRILSGGVDAQALYPPKKFFGAARNIENGGSLTIISSALVETGSKMDEVIFEEFKGTGNMELRLSRELADKRLFPAIDVNASGTRREELITNPQELPIIYRLRRLLGGMEPEQAYQTLVPRLKKTATNRDFLTAIVQQANGNAVNGN